MRVWRNWQTRMVEGHVPVKGVVVRIHSPALLMALGDSAMAVAKIVIWKVDDLGCDCLMKVS